MLIITDLSLVSLIVYGVLMAITIGAILFSNEEIDKDDSRF